MLFKDNSLVKDKRGISVIIGYVLLIVFAIVMAVIVYQWLSTYVPREPLSCPDGISVFLKEASLNTSTSQLQIRILNNGRYNLAGYFIHASNSSTQKIPNLDLSVYLNESGEGEIYGNAILFSLSQGNALKPGEEATNIFTVPNEFGEIYSLQVIPTIFEENENKERFVSCGESRVQQIVGEPIVCEPNCNGRSCGSDGCGGSCGSCESGFFCNNFDGQCLSSQCLPATNPCGSFVCGTVNNGTCGSVSCGTCSTGFSCNTTVGSCIADCGNGTVNTGEGCDDGGLVSGDGCSSTCTVENGYGCIGSPSVCTLNCGNGNIDAGEGCDDGDTTGGDGCSSGCSVESGWSCVGEPSVCSPTQGGGSFNSCGDYCDSFTGYGNVNSCVQNPSQCAGAGKTYIGNVPGANATYGNSFCNIGNADTCCCTPG